MRLQKTICYFKRTAFAFLIEEFQPSTASELQMADGMFRALADRRDDNGGLLRGDLDDVERMGEGSLR